LAAALFGGPGCSARNVSSDVSAAELQSDSSLEIECERELVYLDTLIEATRRDRLFPPALLAEAIELRRAAGELFLTDEFELALELIDEAVALLKGSP
jgi:hypothetical protein